MPTEPLESADRPTPKPASSCTGEPSREGLATEYGPRVRAIATKIKRTLSKDIELDDLVGFGMVGLMEAAKRYDGGQGVSFGAFSYHRVRGAIYDGLRDMGWVSRAEHRRSRRHGQAYLASSSRADPEGSQPDIVLGGEAGLGRASGASLAAIYVTTMGAIEDLPVVDESRIPLDEALQARQTCRLVAEAVAKLPQQEGTLITLYYYGELSLEEVGKRLGLSKSWTSRLHGRAMEKLGRLLKSLLDEYADERLVSASEAKRLINRSNPSRGAADNG